MNLSDDHPRTGFGDKDLTNTHPCYMGGLTDDLEKLSLGSEASTKQGQSSRTARRAQLRKNQKLHGADGIKARTEIGVQCDMLHSDILETCIRLRRKLHNSRLRNLALRGEMVQLKKASGIPTPDWDQVCVPSSSDSGVGDEGDEEKGADNESFNDNDDLDDNEGDAIDIVSSDSAIDTDASSSILDDTVEVGDVVELHGLTRANEINGYYGKVVSYDSSTGRHGVKLHTGKCVSVKLDNLRMGMKSYELDDDDGDMLLRLKPTPEDIRSLPYPERMQKLSADFASSSGDHK